MIIIKIGIRVTSKNTYSLIKFTLRKTPSRASNIRPQLLDSEVRSALPHWARGLSEVSQRVKMIKETLIRSAPPAGELSPCLIPDK